MFENDVKMYGTETKVVVQTTAASFENDVKMYGTETGNYILPTNISLRMM